jgi:hypothetical protein
MKRDILVEGLKRNLMKVNFTKVNGEERTMNCSLHESLLPESTPSATTKKENLDVIAVWDIDKGAWRSFRLDSITDYTVIEGMI